MLDTSLFAPLKLRRGAGKDYKNGLCFMEAAAWLAGEGATDKPECACPVLGRYGIVINDTTNTETRQKLLPLAYEMAGTRDASSEEKRGKFLSKHTRRMVLEYIEDARRVRMHPVVARYLVECADRMEESNRRGYWDDSADAIWRLMRSIEHERCHIAEPIHFMPFFPSTADVPSPSTLVDHMTHYDLRDRIATDMIEILAAAIRIGPNGAAAWRDYIEPATRLGEFAKRELVTA
jgi:hypothetical protein